MSLEQRWRALIEQLRAQGRFRELTLPKGVDFKSNDYLGYSKTPPRSDSRALPCSGISSRLLRGHHAIWEEVETALARWHGAEAALMLPSGYAANTGLLTTVLQPGDWVASDQFNHASIIDGLRLAGAERFVFRHQDMDQLEAALREASRTRTPERELFVVTESLFSMEGDCTALDQLVPLAERYGAHLVVDEAHSTGCFGPAGSGCVDAAGLRSRVLATVHTGGKALGVHGGYVCGSARLRTLLINRCRHFIFTTALPPRMGAWWMEAIARAKGDDAGRAALHHAAQTLRSELERHGVATLGGHYIVPVVLGRDDDAIRVARKLQAAGWDIPAIRPPSVPEGTARLRISVHADHDPALLNTVAAAIADSVSDSNASGGVA